jgi:hypothetical protein
MIDQVAWNKSSLLLKNILQNIQTTIYVEYLKNVFTKFIKIPSWEAWVERPSGLIKREGDGQAH